MEENVPKYPRPTHHFLFSSCRRFQKGQVFSSFFHEVQKLPVITHVYMVNWFHFEGELHMPISSHPFHSAELAPRLSRTALGAASPFYLVHDKDITVSTEHGGCRVLKLAAWSGDALCITFRCAGTRGSGSRCCSQTCCGIIILYLLMDRC